MLLFLQLGEHIKVDTHIEVPNMRKPKNQNTTCKNTTHYMYPHISKQW